MSSLGEVAVDAIIPFLADNDANSEGKGYAIEGILSNIELLISIVVKNVFSKNPQELFAKTKGIFMKMISNYKFNTPLTNALVAFTLAEMKVPILGELK